MHSWATCLIAGSEHHGKSAMHHQAVLGSVRTAVLAVARFLIKRTTPLVKLH